MCLGGHLAYRCALDSRVKAAVCYFATDIHSKTLARGKNDDSLERAGDINGELLMVCYSFFLVVFLFFGAFLIVWYERVGNGYYCMLIESRSEL